MSEIGKIEQLDNTPSNPLADYVKHQISISGEGRALTPDQEEQVREIIREEIAKAIKKLIETGVIGD